MDQTTNSAAAELRHISHDVNNLLAVLQGQAEALSRGLAADAADRRHLDSLMETLHRLELLARKFSTVVSGGDVSAILPALRRSEAPSPVAGSETVLLVDDEAALRGVTGRFLGLNGYKVVEAGSLKEAMDVDAALPSGADILVTDLQMPGGNGSELARLLRERRPALKVIYLSGHDAVEMRRHVADAPEKSFLSKPFRPKELLVRIREILDEKPAGGS